MVRMETMERLSTFTADQVRDWRANDFVRFVSSLAEAGKQRGAKAVTLSDELDRIHAAEHFLSHYGPQNPNRSFVERAATFQTKAATNPGTTLEPAWGAPLAPIRPLIDAFVDVARPASLLGKLQAAARVPFNVSVPVASSGGTYKWVGQSAPKPIGNMSLSSVSLPILKASGMFVVTKELLTLSAPASVTVLRREMIRGMSQFLDAQLSDPTAVAVAATSPASITNGAPSIGSAGSTPANSLTDFRALVSAFIAVNPDASSMAVLTSPGNATALAVAANAQTLGPDGGTLYGVPVFTGAVGGRVIVVDPTALLVADDGDLDLSIAFQATVEMDAAPTSPPTASTVMVGLWALNLAGLRIDRFVNFKMARPNSVIYTNQTYI
jgi:hypothetical protein